MPYEIPSAETIGAATFADCGENKSHLKLFRVNAGYRLCAPGVANASDVYDETHGIVRLYPK